MPILFGKNPILEALRANRRKIHEVYIYSPLPGGEGDRGRVDFEKLLSLCAQQKIPVKKVDKNKLDSLTEGAPHQGVAAKVEGFPYSSLDEVLTRFSDSCFLLIGDSIQDPQNLGAICRSAYCLGVDALILNRDQSAEINATVSKASAGAVEHLPVAKVTNLARCLEELKQNGFWSYGADSEAKESLTQITLSSKMAVVIGNEGKGIRPLVAKSCDVHFSIPMARAFDSLNVAQAAAVICYEVFRKRLPPLVINVKGRV